MGTKIVTQPIIVGENETFEQDILGRKEFGESLLRLVSISSDELVISLDGKWGEGKTTFVKMWQGLLDKENIPNIYVNAYENDYSDDAFISIASAITAYIKEKKIKLPKFKEKAKKIGVQLLSVATKVGINVATSGAIQVNDFKKLKNINSAVVNDIISEKLESHKKNVELIQSFKDLLSKIPNTLNPNEDKPLVIIIDELDRCKPTYAVDLIEKVKHLFSVKNVVFVLVMHKEQLEESVKSVYGQNIDAHTYLQKFINIEISLPKKTGEEHDNDIKKYNEMLYNSCRFIIRDNIIAEFLEVLAMHFNLSLRQLEKVYTTLAVYCALSGRIADNLFPIVAFLAVIKTRDPSLYQALLHQRITYEELCTKTRLSDRIINSSNMTKILACIHGSFLTDNELRKLEHDDQHNLAITYAQVYGSKRNNIIPSLAKRLSMFTVV